MRNALSHVPKTSAMMAATIRTVFAQPYATGARDQWRRVADSFRRRFSRLAEVMDDAETDVLAYTTFPVEHESPIPSGTRIPHGFPYCHPCLFWE